MRTIQRDIVGAFIFSVDGKMLLGKGGVYADTWIVPGGGIDDGETKLEALKREIREETGLDITVSMVEEIEGVLTGQSEKTLRDSGERVLVEMRFFNYTVNLNQPAEEIKLKTEDDFIEAAWFATSELKDMPLSPPTITTLQKLGYL